MDQLPPPFLPVDPGSDFPLQNLPWGVFTPNRPGSGAGSGAGFGGDHDESPWAPRIGVALGDHVVDVRALRRAGLFSGPILSTEQGACLEQASVWASGPGGEVWGERPVHVRVCVVGRGGGGGPAEGGP